ncbi:SIR2 family NAD-dependent protein deacylase [Kitasatospora aureofaciens]|uniref:protein acetyllysine N-acetyltransferase n=1 Tax=Kitasatospora aureofaciens TaxID=1894 RepID=A0A1E7NAD3_KITAU|nr:Sir2 family NAD-dependent protein deacetylase [Kitasatospora aureofaciens]QEV01155.1 NAD-dependent deacetylase [Streptomyces viridifaciens]ARF79906.1 NAD-dependent deacetylase [Kitasatospora aureofaciens]OEV37649.1 NAD-dependent deacetylase [Kitasatospora aureofaciens]UKZ07512.1 NAD-dependent deacetylase [Streptomyces viridifaciens]GGU90934.1 NAD-dependent protein deacetylase 2 [Kitasatospora aureofaciens]
MNAKRPLIAVLTGAGISTDSGIPDYRGPQGLWQRDPSAQELVTIGPYLADPEVRKRAWLMRRDAGAMAAEPNAGHRALVDLERSGLPLRVLTQNVDGLHQRAGLPARKVFELHGTAREVQCARCRVVGPMDEALARVAAGEPDPACRECGGILRPRTVMFGEALDPVVLQQADAVAKACDLFVAVGTSLQVFPVAGLPLIAVETGAKLIIVNAEPTPYDEAAAEVIREPISTALPELVRRLVRERA